MRVILDTGLTNSGRGSWLGRVWRGVALCVMLARIGCGSVVYSAVVVLASFDMLIAPPFFFLVLGHDLITMLFYMCVLYAW